MKPGQNHILLDNSKSMDISSITKEILPGKSTISSNFRSMGFCEIGSKRPPGDRRRPNPMKVSQNHILLGNSKSVHIFSITKENLPGKSMISSNFHLMGFRWFGSTRSPGGQRRQDAVKVSQNRILLGNSKSVHIFSIMKGILPCKSRFPSNFHSMGFR